MKCVAIGDMFLSEKAFQDTIKKCGLFEEYQGFSWNANLNRKDTRALIRDIETKGSEACEVNETIQQAMLQADVIFTHLCPISKKIITTSNQLKYIVTARGGVEHIAVEAAKKKGIAIIHCPIHNACAVAELTIGLMICETRNITRSHVALKQGIWREDYPNTGHIRELRSCTIGIIGFGAIGRMVVERLRPFQSTIYVYDPYVSKEEIEAAHAIAVDKETLLKESDIISLHGRIGPNDPPVIRYEELQMMKKTSYLINTARAVLVDMDALANALQNGEIAGAALDVFPQEPIPTSDPFFDIDCCTLSNHRGGDTLDAYDRSPELLVEQLKEVLTSGNTRYLIK